MTIEIEIAGTDVKCLDNFVSDLLRISSRDGTLNDSMLKMLAALYPYYNVPILQVASRLLVLKNLQSPNADMII
jgi:hypothetical protein